MKFHFLWLSKATLLTDTTFNFPRSKMPPEQSEPFLLIPRNPSCWDTAANPKLSWDLGTRTPAILWTSSVCLTEPVWMWPKPQLPRGDPSAPSLTALRQSSSIPPWAAVHSSLPLQQERNPRKHHLPDSSPQAAQNWGSALLQLHASLQYCCPEFHSVLPGWLFTSFGGLGRGNTWEDAQLFHNFCSPFFQQVNKSKHLIVFAPLLLPESIKITHKITLGSPHQPWNKQGL